MKNETVGNLSHLPPEIIAAIRAMLSGRQLVDIEDGLRVERSLPHGHVAAVLEVLRFLDLERLISRERSRERDLVVAMICQLLLAPGSKLSFTRCFGQSTLAEELELEEVTEAELMRALDWLLDRQDRIEKALAARHLSAGGFALYDLFSSYLEGRCCPLATLGYSRDGRRGTLQVTWGLLCSPEGRPVSVRVHPGSTADPDTLPAALDTRTELLLATERELSQVVRMVKGPRGRLRGAAAGVIGERVGRVVNRYKMARHFELRITDGAFSYARKEAEIAAEAALDGIYVLRTTCREDELGPQAVVRLYKQLKMVERAHRAMKDALEVRPIRHHLENRVRAHFFLFMLAYYVLFELSERLRPLLYSDECPLAPVDPVAPAARSKEALAKAGSAKTADGLPAMSLSDLLAELGTLGRSEVRIGQGEHTFSRLTAPTAIQAKAFELLGIKLSR